MRGHCEPETDGREGLRSLELLITAYISSQDNKTVSLPIDQKPEEPPHPAGTPP
jgi:UDP-N-acetyl-2-amino-2-deoxyglucuronate dehydrogenase